MLNCHLFVRAVKISYFWAILGEVGLDGTAALPPWLLLLLCGGGDDMFTYRKREFRDDSLNWLIDMLLGIYKPVIIHDLQSAATYWINAFSNQSL